MIPLLRVPLSRRHVLRGAGACIALPFLEAMAPRKVLAATAPKFVVFFSPNGTIAKNWAPTRTSETDFTLSPILAPLEPLKSSLTIIQGVDQQGGGGDGHQNGMGGMLTGTSLNPGPFLGGAGAGPAGWASGPSVDQRIAEAIGQRAKFRSIELGVQVGNADNWGRMSYRGSDRPVAPEDDPQRAFDRIFSDITADPVVLAARRARRKSILDAVREQTAATAARLGGADRQRLDAHLTGVRDVEERLLRIDALPAACKPIVPAGKTVAGNDAFPAVGAVQMDLLAMALACNLTQVASLQWSRSVSQQRFTWLGVREGHHDLSHLGDDDAGAVDKLTRINKWYATAFASLCTKLKETIDGDTGASLLDNSLVLWCNELGTGNTHSRKDAPYILAGSAAGVLKPGRHLVYEGDVPHNNLLVSLLNAMGVADQTFGNPQWCTGPLPGLLI